MRCPYAIETAGLALTNLKYLWSKCDVQLSKKLDWFSYMAHKNYGWKTAKISRYFNIEMCVNLSENDGKHVQAI